MPNPIIEKAQKCLLPVPQPVKEETFYRVALTPEEVVFLNVTLGKIGGSPEGSIRKFSDSISNKLPFARPVDIDYDYDPCDYGPNKADAIYYGPGSFADAFHKAADSLR